MIRIIGCTSWLRLSLGKDLELSLELGFSLEVELCLDLGFRCG